MKTSMSGVLNKGYIASNCASYANVFSTMEQSTAGTQKLKFMEGKTKKQAAFSRFETFTVEWKVINLISGIWACDYISRWSVD